MTVAVRVSEGIDADGDLQAAPVSVPLHSFDLVMPQERRPAVLRSVLHR